MNELESGGFVEHGIFHIDFQLNLQFPARSLVGFEKLRMHMYT
jgi:hypothetical protein